MAASFGPRSARPSEAPAASFGPRSARPSEAPPSFGPDSDSGAAKDSDNYAVPRASASRRDLALAIAGAAFLLAGLVATVFAFLTHGGSRQSPAPKEGELPVAPLPPPLPLTTPTPGALRGVMARYFRLIAAPSADPLTLPSALQVDLTDAAGAFIPPGERHVLRGAEGAWAAADLRRERNVTRVVFSSLDPALSQSSSRAVLQVMDHEMRTLCSVPFGDQASQRLVFDLEGAAAEPCREALRARQNTPLSAILGRE